MQSDLRVNFFPHVYLMELTCCCIAFVGIKVFISSKIVKFSKISEILLRLTICKKRTRQIRRNFLILLIKDKSYIMQHR